MRIIKPSNTTGNSKQSPDSELESGDFAYTEKQSVDEKKSFRSTKAKVAKKNKRKDKRQAKTAEPKQDAEQPQANLEPQPSQFGDGRKRRRSEYSNVPFYTSSLAKGPSVDNEPQPPVGLNAGEETSLTDLFDDDTQKEFNRLLASGIRLLGMREHSVKEITDKLLAKTEMHDTVYAVVDDLLENKYLSDERFTEAYVRFRASKGFGPVKIRAELSNKGISSQLVQEYLEIGAAMWLDVAGEQHEKKFGKAPVPDYKAWTKRARFMQSRGFTMEHIQLVLPRVEFND